MPWAKDNDIVVHFKIQQVAIRRQIMPSCGHIVEHNLYCEQAACAAISDQYKNTQRFNSTVDRDSDFFFNPNSRNNVWFLNVNLYKVGGGTISFM